MFSSEIDWQEMLGMQQGDMQLLFFLVLFFCAVILCLFEDYFNRGDK